MDTKTKLNLYKGLPDTKDLARYYIEDRISVLNECLSFQNYPYQRWKTHDLQRYLEHQWLPIPWTDANNSKLPFGYEKDPERAIKMGVDPDSILFPIEDQLFALEEAKILVKKYQYKSVAAWLKKKTGRSITPSSLMRRLESEKRRSNRAELYKKIAIRLAKALIAAARIEEDFPGAKAPWVRDRNYVRNANSGGKGRPPSKPDGAVTTEWLRQLFRIVDPRPYIRAVNGQGRETEEGQAPEKPGTSYPTRLDDICGGGPSREHIPSA